MALVLLAVFIGLPLLEIAVFIEVGGVLGVWPTIAATIATALAGSILLRAQGLAALTRARSQMDQGQLPAREMFEGVFLVLAGALLLVPGFVTDALGLLLFIPAVRELLRLLIARRIAAKAARGEARVFVDGVEIGPGRGPGGSPPSPGAGHPNTGHPGPQGPRTPGTSRPGGQVIDGDYKALDENGDGRSPAGRSDRRRLGR